MYWADLSSSGRVTPTRTRSALTGILVVIAVIGAVVPWLAIAEAWRIAGDPTMFPAPAQDVSRWLFVAEMMSYGLFTSGGGISVLAMGATVAVLVIAAGSRAVDTRTGRWRTVDLAVAVALLASVAAALAALARLLLVGYAWTSTPDELIGIYVSDSSGMSVALRLLAPAAEVLGWTAVLLLALAWRRRDDGALPGDDLDEDDPGHPDDPGEDASVETPPADPLPGVPRERVDPARLRPDGSSDSGFDEFHFRR